MAAGAVAGYAVQVGENRSQGMDWGKTLTTNISAEKILGGAVIAGGAIIMSNLSNPIVKGALAQLNGIISSSTSRIWKGSWISKDPIPVYEYIENGVGIVREQASGALVSVVSRVGENLDKLQRLVDAGKGQWLR